MCLLSNVYVIACVVLERKKNFNFETWGMLLPEKLPYILKDRVPWRNHIYCAWTTDITKGGRRLKNYQWLFLLLLLLVSDYTSRERAHRWFCTRFSFPKLDLTLGLLHSYWRVESTNITPWIRAFLNYFFCCAMTSCSRLKEEYLVLASYFSFFSKLYKGKQELISWIYSVSDSLCFSSKSKVVIKKHLTFLTTMLIFK